MQRKKNSFLRLKWLIGLLMKDHGGSLKIYEEGTDGAWQEAMDILHEKWDKDGRPIALRNVLKALTRMSKQK